MDACFESTCINGEDLEEFSDDEGAIGSYSASVSSSPSPSVHSELPVSLHWFRNFALRLHDNPALTASLARPSTQFKAVFVLDTWFVGGGVGGTSDRKYGVNRLRFLLECLHDLQNQLDAFGLRLYVARGQTTAVFASLFQEWNVSHLTYQKSQEPHSETEEKTINEMAADMNIQVESFHGHTLYDPADVLKLSDKKKPLLTFKEFRNLLSKLKHPSLPVPSPSPKSSSHEEDDTPLMIVRKFQIPTLSSLGYDNESLGTNHWMGGETEALKRLDTYCSVRSQPFKDPLDCLFDKSSVSPYIRFGCLSVRYFWHHVRQLAANDKSKASLAQTVSSKLLEREFYFLVSSQVPNFDCDKENPICVPLPWEQDPTILHKWKSGQTGYPWIDAAVRQMIQEGWIHHLLRESIATFLTRGDLWLSWVNGAETFETHMLDFEPSVSCGCWMKSSSCAFILGQIEHYNPITYGQKIDPNGRYIRHFIPQLRDMPSEYIFCPWMAPLDVQRKSNCIVGVNYPHPVIDHMTAGVICMERLKSFMGTLCKSHNAALS